jgi:hypothetical protein
MRRNRDPVRFKHHPGLVTRHDAREPERWAAAAAAVVLGARARAIDVPGGPPGQRDFDLVFPDCTIEPLEVTSNAHAPSRQTSARAADHSSQPTTLTRTWLLSLPRGTEKPVDVARVRRQVVEPLRVLEACGIESLNDVWLFGPASAASTAARMVSSLGVTSGVSVTPDDGIPRLELAVMYGDAVDVDSVAEAAETVARRADNRQKLREPPVAMRRHLFMLLDWSGGSASWAARDAIEREKMPRIPTLPDPITTVWVAASRRSVLYVSPPGPWRTAHLPTDFEQRYGDWLTD